MSVSETFLIVWVGIDVSKRSLDVAIWSGGKKYVWRKFSNEASSLPAILAWAKAQAGDGAELRFCMESTADYGVAAAMFFTESGYHVSVMNPARIKYYGMASGRLTKTDKADAKLIAQFASEKAPAAWPMQDKSMREFFRLFRRRLQVQEMITMEKCRRECPQAIGESCMASIKAVLKALRTELRSIEEALWAAIEADSELKAKSELIRSIEPLGQASIFLILAEMPPVDEVASAASYAACAGVQPTSKSSGEKQPESAPMSRSGRRNVRRGLYMATLTGLRKIPELKALYDRLRLRGRKHKQAMVACIRKLLMIVYGVLKSKTPFKSRLPDPVCSTTA